MHAAHGHSKVPDEQHGHASDQRHDHGHANPAGQAHRPGQSHEQAHSVPANTEGKLITWARLYDPVIWLMARGQTRTLRTVPLELAALRPGERVLDVGCGTGDLALAAARWVGPGGAVCGIDAATEMIEVAGRKAHRAGPNVRFQVEPVEAMRFPDGSFDVVLSSMMMHHLPGDLKSRALAEIGRVLRPGGRILIVDFQPPAKPPRLWQSGGLITWAHSRGSRPGPAPEAQPPGANLAALLREAGFTAVEHGPTRTSWMVYARAQAPTRDNPVA